MSSLSRFLIPAAAFVLLAVLAGCSTCSIPRDPMAAKAGERCFIEDDWFVVADRMYARYGTLDLTARHLREEFQWRECEVNEAIYRLRKAHTLP